MIEEKFLSLEYVDCPLGCKDVDEFVLTGRDNLHDLPGYFNVVRCKSCGIMRTNPRPTQSCIGFYYPESYGPYLSSKVSLNHKPKMWKRSLRRLLKINDIRIPTIKTGRMLEIGCSSGSYMHRMAVQNWDVEGIEFSPFAAMNARSFGFKVHIGSVESAPDPEYQYDIVVGWMVLEHLHEPVKVLKKLKRWTKPNGWIAISVPNAASLEFKIFKDLWYALQLPTHLYHFTPDTIKKLFEYSGWNVEKVLHQQNLNNLISSIGLILKKRIHSAVLQNI